MGLGTPGLWLRRWTETPVAWVLKSAHPHCRSNLPKRRRRQYRPHAGLLLGWQPVGDGSLSMLRAGLYGASATASAASISRRNSEYGFAPRTTYRGCTIVSPGFVIAIKKAGVPVTPARSPSAKPRRTRVAYRELSKQYPNATASTP